LVALLANSPDVGRWLAQLWLPDAVPHLASVTPTIQRAVGGKVGWVDLELVLDSPPRAVIWVEVKLGSKLAAKTSLTSTASA
jgi:hypothetical protein